MGHSERIFQPRKPIAWQIVSPLTHTHTVHTMIHRVLEWKSDLKRKSFRVMSQVLSSVEHLCRVLQASWCVTLMRFRGCTVVLDYIYYISLLRPGWPSTACSLKCRINNCNTLRKARIEPPGWTNTPRDLQNKCLHRGIKPAQFRVPIPSHVFFRLSSCGLSSAHRLVVSGPAHDIRTEHHERGGILAVDHPQSTRSQRSLEKRRP